MRGTLTHQLLDDHLLRGDPTVAGRELALRVDQTLTHDASGAELLRELDTLDLDGARTEVSVQYVDHDLLQLDPRSADDHALLRRAAHRHGLWFSPPGNGIGPVVHQEFFGIPGKCLVGSDVHTAAAGALGMLAVGADAPDVARAIAGEPCLLPAPRVRRVQLVGTLRPGVSAKDIALEMLRRHGTVGAIGWVLEFHGPGVEQLSVMDRHVIASMGTQTGATTTVFPADARTREFLGAMGREGDHVELAARAGARGDAHEKIDLDSLVPLVALAPSPANVVAVHEVAGRPIAQACIGSTGNPGRGDLHAAARVLDGARTAPGVALDINPASRRTLEALARDGVLNELLAAGARLHQTGCSGPLGMGPLPAPGKVSLRTAPSHVSARSRTRDGIVHLVSPETAAASARTGVLTDPRTLVGDSVRQTPPVVAGLSGTELFEPPPPRPVAWVRRRQRHGPLGRE